MIREHMVKKCAFWGHKWRPVFISGEYNGIKVKFIGCYCTRCNIGNDEIFDILRKRTVARYGTYSQSFFDEDKAVWCESSEMIQIKDNAVEMLVALIKWAMLWEKQFEPSRLFEETVPIIEKATGKSWEEIKELYELHD